MTLVAAFNAAVVGPGALLLGIPLAGTITVVTFLAAYVPYIGAWTAGAFSVLVALGGAGTDAAVGMLIIQLLANSVLQQLVQPIAMGTALGVHPARRPHRHGRRARPLRGGGIDPRGADHGRRHPHLGGPFPGPGGEPAA